MYSSDGSGRLGVLHRMRERKTAAIADLIRISSGYPPKGPLRNNFGVLRFPPDGSHWTGPGGITTGQLLGHTEDPENRWSGRSVAGQLSPRWDKPSGSGMWQEVFRASIAEMESRQFAELIFDSSLRRRADSQTGPTPAVGRPALSKHATMSQPETLTPQIPTLSSCVKLREILIGELR